MLGGLDPHTAHHLVYDILILNSMKPEIKPKVGKFYYIDYEDKDEAAGSYFGIAECIKVYDRDETGKPIEPPLYEFIHPQANGEMVRALYYASEITTEFNF